ncbi:uncharacterized protein LOC106153268 [Lingula anatina]|uniref:Uncharacterized protein LOC106153268 n=1 Tax=Lingula anatina TaxID=7574 RepID=A0A1S3HBS2_LINAN|nr:uncharacterized protein LOC106153268 [Lingula anatina]|eukprot:XP_013382589.1 uncharacterized protein LOC106153268 [Lingula anatina]
MILRLLVLHYIHTCNINTNGVKIGVAHFQGFELHSFYCLPLVHLASSKLFLSSIRLACIRIKGLFYFLAAPVTNPPATAPPTTVQTSPRNSGETISPAEFCSSRSSGRYADPADCTFFYTCSRGTGRRSRCVGVLKFNANIGACDWPRNVNC